MHVCIVTARYSQAFTYCLVKEIGLTSGGRRDGCIPIDSHSYHPILYIKPTISLYYSANRLKN